MCNTFNFLIIFSTFFKEVFPLFLSLSLSFSHLFGKYLKSAFYAPSSVMGTGRSKMSKSNLIPFPMKCLVHCQRQLGN